MELRRRVLAIPVGVEHAPVLVHHAVVDLLGHAATAQGVHGERGRAGLRVVGSAHQPGGRAQCRVFQQHAGIALDHRERLRVQFAEPLALLRAVLQLQPLTARAERHRAGRAVVSHDQQQLRVAERAGIERRPIVQRLPTRESARQDVGRAQLRQQAKRGEQLVRDARQRARDGGVLDQQPVFERAVRRHADAAGDGRPDAGTIRGVVGLANSDPVDFLAGQVGRGQIVAIGRQALAQGARERQLRPAAPRIAAAQQNFRAAEGARRQDHLACPQYMGQGGGAGARILGGVRGLEADAPMLAVALQPQHRHPGVQARAGGFRARQIAVGEGLLGVEVAARHAFAATDAQVRLQLALSGIPIGAGFLRAQLHAEFDRCKARVLSGLSHAVGQRLEPRHLLRRSPLRTGGLAVDRHRALIGGPERRTGQRGARGRQMRLQRRQIDVVRPDAVPAVGALEDCIVRRHHHVGVDLAATAKRVADQGADAAAEADVEQRRIRPQALRRAAPIEAHHVDERAQAAGELATQILVAALQHADLHAPLGQAQGGNRAAIARADHHHLACVRFGLQLLDQLVCTAGQVAHAQTRLCKNRALSPPTRTLPAGRADRPAAPA